MSDKESESAGRIIVVSGMPRSGTSMMMQMLEAGGLEIYSDGQRAADPDNPNGYFELEATKRLKTDSAFLAKAGGRVVKVVAPLLPDLPARYEYRVIFMQRAIEEVLASQSGMLERASRRSGSRPVDTQLADAFGQVSHRVKRWLEEATNVATCFIEHRAVMASPLEASREVFRFLDESPSPGWETGAASHAAKGDEEAAIRMAAVVDQRLYRQRF